MTHDHEREALSLLREALLPLYRSLPGYEPDRLPETMYFTPTRLMYQAYVRWLSRNREDAQPVGGSFFGRSLGSTIGADPFLRVQRFYEGRREWGYLGVKGPGSILVSSQRGRRATISNDADEAAAPAAEVQGSHPAD